MRYLRQSTAATITLGPFVDKGDGVTPLTALAGQVGRASKDGIGSAFTPASWAHDAGGFYAVGLAAGDTGVVGRLEVRFTDPASYLPVWEGFTVLSAAVYDVLFGAAAPSTHDAAAVAALVLASPSNRLATDAAGRVVLQPITHAGATVPTVAALAGHTPQSGDAFARIGAAGAGLTALGDARLDRLDVDVSSRSTFGGGVVAGVAAPVTVGAVNDKSGYTLAADGLDAIDVSDPGPPADQTTLPRMLVALWRRFYKKTTLSATDGLRTYADDGVTVNGTQAVADDGSTQVLGASS